MEEKKIKEQLRIAYIIARSLQGKISEEEKQELEEWLNFNEKNKEYYNQISKETKLEQKNIKLIDINVVAARKKVWKKHKRNKVIKLFKKGMKYAALFIGLVGLVYIYQTKNFNQNN